jgi:GAF domain-containing protein
MDQERVLGVLTLAHPEPGRFNGQDLALLTAFAAVASRRLVQAESAVLE